MAPLPDWQTLTFHFSRPAVSPADYTIQLQPDGLSVYWEGPPDFNTEEAVGVRKITVSTAVLQTLTASMETVRSGKCETRQKHIAKTGQKTIVYEAKSTSATCEFNFSDDDKLNETASAFIAIAETLQAGARLEQKHRFDRLGLDAEMDAFAQEVAAKRALEVQNIAPVLQSIADDDRVIDRVRRKAARLLQEGSDISPPSPR